MRRAEAASNGGLFFSPLGLLAITLLVACIYFVYEAALPGILQFDDKANLSGLAKASDWTSAWRWALQGNAGPTGRPLALLTFALQAYQWPNPAPLLRWNIALQAINALLVFWLALLVSRLLGRLRRDQLFIGFFTALAWALLPLLNTSVLFIVQRMTLLSGTCTLAGLVAYLKLRGAADARWPRQLGAVVVLGAFGVLALLSKESGALTVVYGAVLEGTIILAARRKRPTVALALLLLGCIALLTQLIPHAFWSRATELRRGFTVWQRLGGEGFLLPLYLKDLFLPVMADLNPFRFQFLLRDYPWMRWGVPLWLACMLLPPILWRLRWRWAALAAAWFFYGQIMESGWVALEPYFAHRNYLPALGPVFLLVAWVASLRGQREWLARGAFVAYVAVLGTVSWMNTSLWGDRPLAAEMWANEEPRSTRAIFHLAYTLNETEGTAAAQRVLEQFIKTERDSIAIRLQNILTSCSLDPERNHAGDVQSLVHAIHTLPYDGPATDVLKPLVLRVQSHPCNGVANPELTAIASAFLSQPAYESSNAIAHNMLSTLGILKLQDDEPELALHLLLESLKKTFTYGEANLVLELASHGHNQAALAELRRLAASTRPPREANRAEWNALRERIDQAAENP